jgi:hypothetical protein
MAKAKKRVAKRKKGSIRGKARVKPMRRNARKHTTVGWTKSKVRRTGTKAANDAHVKLEGMDLDHRIAAVAADVKSKRDEYRSIEPYELASLLGVPNARISSGDWEERIWYVPHQSVEDVFSQWDEG